MALDQCQTVLLQERERTQGYKYACDRLQFSQREHKREIKDILSSTGSVEQHIYL
jgi:hypothetical protein